MFDWVEITVRAGSGGGGAISFRREKFAPFGGPDGGDGGDGGNVVIKADPAVASLLEFRRKRFFKAGNGGNGQRQKKHGKNGDDLVLTVPVGTVVVSKTTVGDDAPVADLEKPGQEVVVKGGAGGLGNTHFASSTNQAPQVAQRGEEGEKRSILLEMRLIADVGIIGYPNVGKSTLLAQASAAKPKIASYPFTTLEPVLGVVEVGQQSFVLAEIPGLIEGAHLGRGLGHGFLRHVLRTKVLIHLIDGTSVSPVDGVAQINAELHLFDPTLAHKHQLVVMNKIDLPEVSDGLAGVRKAFRNAGVTVHFISAVTGEGVAELMAEAVSMLSRVAPARASVHVSQKVFRPQPRVRGVTVREEGGVFIVDAPGLERLTTRTGATGAEVRWQLKRQLARRGCTKALERAGVKPGDTIRCGTLEWEW